MSRVLRLALIPVLFSLAFIQADEDGWEDMNRLVMKFSVRDVSGAKLTEKSLEGKIVVIDFWATWCGPCVQELPEIKKFADSVKSKKDVAFLSFSVDDDPADVVKFFKDRQETFPVYMAGSLSDRMGVTIFPTKLIIDGRKSPAKLRFRRAGATLPGEIEDHVTELLKQP